MMAKDTASQLLDVAQRFIQERGYNAFSYKDLGETVGIRTASIHYHFPAKVDLGKALMERYLAELKLALGAIDRSRTTNKAKLEAYIELYRHTESAGAICLCGSLASDRQTLPETLQETVSAYLDYSEGWVAEKVAEGIRDGEFGFPGQPEDAAVALLSNLQGGLLLSHARGGRPHLEAVQRVFLQTLAAE